MGLVASKAEVRGAQAFLRALGANWHSNTLIVAIVAWERHESGGIGKVIGNNPFNIRPGAMSYLSSGKRKSTRGNGWFLVFPSIEVGFKAAALLLKSLAPHYGYGLVLKAIKADRAADVIVALAMSKWDSGHYGVKEGGNAADPNQNNLLKLFYQFTGLKLPPDTSDTSVRKDRMPVVPAVLRPPVYRPEYLDGWTAKRFYMARHPMENGTL